MNNKNDAELLRKVYSFDPAAITEVYDRYSPGIYRYAMRLTGLSDQAEDCVAETFSRFLAAISAGNGPRDNLQAYLYRIAHNWITDYYRRSPILVELDEYRLSDGSHDMLTHAVEMEFQQKRIRRALAQLKAEQRQVVVLRYLEEWDMEDIAHVLEKPVGAVRAVLHRAVVKLRSLLHGEDFDHEDGYETRFSI